MQVQVLDFLCRKPSEEGMMLTLRNAWGTGWQVKLIVIVARYLHIMSFKSGVKDYRQGSISRCSVWGHSKMHTATMKYLP